MKKHLEPGESHYWRPKFTAHLVFVDYRRLDGTLLGAFATDEQGAEEWIAEKVAADRPVDAVDFGGRDRRVASC